MEKYAFAELLDGGKPFDAAREVGPIHRKLDFVKLAFGGSRRRLKARKAVQADDLTQLMHLDDVLQKASPGLLKLEAIARQGFGVQE